MITEDYVSFETAKLLKDKGFDGECLFVANKESKGVMPVSWPTTNSDIKAEQANLITVPTLQMAMKWLREVHNIDINIYAESVSHKKGYTTSIWKNIQEDGAINDVILGVSTIYEEACEAAIKYCLENLI